MQKQRKTSNTTTSEIVLESLREQIINGILQPQEKLVEAEIARKFGLSRGPVREALRQLAVEGLVDYCPNKGCISKISGSEGMAGGTDGNWVLTKSKRTDTRANLTISNRDTEAFEFALEFDKESCRWNKLTRDESVVNEKERFLHAIVNFIKAEEAHHWEGTATELLTILQAREPILVSYSAAVFSKSLKAAQDSLREIYGVSYVSAFHNKKKWITLDYIEVK